MMNAQMTSACFHDSNINSACNRKRINIQEVLGDHAIRFGAAPLSKLHACNIIFKV